MDNNTYNQLIIMKKTKTILMVAISILVPLITGFYLMNTIYETGESENYMNQDRIGPDLTTPVLNSAELISGNYNLAWTLPPSSLGTPDGDYDVFIDGVDTNKEHRTTSMQTQIHTLDTSVSHCFSIQPRWTQVADDFPVSNEICVPPSESTTQPDENIETFSNLEIPQCYKFVTKWGTKGTGDGQFLRAHDIDFDPSGEFIYVSDRDRNDIQKFDSEGNFITKWGSTGSAPGQFDIPYGLDVDSDGNVYVADRENHRIQKFDSEGNFIEEYYQFGKNLKFKEPEEVEFDDTNQVIYVTDTGNDRIIKFDSDFNFLKMWGSSGDSPGEFRHPHGMALDSKGNVYVSERDNTRIQKFDSEGNFILSWGREGTDDGEFVHLEHIDIGNNDLIFVTDGGERGASGGENFQVFDTEGNFLMKVGSAGTGDGQFGEAEHSGVDPEGNVYITERKNARVSKFSPSNDCLGIP